MTASNLNRRFVVDEKGQRVAVLLDIAEYDDLVDARNELRSRRAEASEPVVAPEEAPPLGAHQHVYHHPRSPDASLASLRRVMGSIRLTSPLPPMDLFDDDDSSENPQGTQDAGS